MIQRARSFILSFTFVWRSSHSRYLFWCARWSEGGTGVGSDAYSLIARRRALMSDGSTAARTVERHDVRPVIVPIYWVTVRGVRDCLNIFGRTRQIRKINKRPQGGRVYVCVCVCGATRRLSVMSVDKG